jgi:cyclohexanone monooxygenase
VADSPIEEITERGVRVGGAELAFDALVYATGFDAMTGALLRVDPRGRDGLPLHEAWAHGAQTYLGIAVAGFPNLFTVTGPGSPSVLSNMIVSIEQHVDWIAGCLEWMRARGLTSVEATADAQDRWVEHVRELGDQTLYPRAKSWYMGANVPGKPRVLLPYVGGVGRYRLECDEIVARGYEGFAFG